MANFVTFTDGTKAKASEVNSNLTRLPPIGSVQAWLKSYTNTPALPDGWVECNGQVLSDSESVYDGQTIPDFNITQRFLRGSSTSGTTGGADTINLQHTHVLTHSNRHDATDSGSQNDRSFFETGTSNNVASSLSATQSILPAYYEVVWIMRVK